MSAEPPIACTLDADALPDRVAAWRTILARARARTVTADDALRLELDDGVDLARVATLVAAEQQCCAFLSFAITVDQRGTALEVRAPAEAASVVAALFGAPAP
jgi:hypothetical protein